jgi:hypothetical protein
MVAVAASFAITVSLVISWYLSASWYFSERIHSEALAAEPGREMPAYDDVRFLNLASGYASLVAIGHQPGLTKPQIYGIAWEGGVGHLGSSISISSGVVKRPISVTFGSAPVTGELAALDRSYFMGEVGAALGIPVTDTVVPGPLGPLPAWYFPGDGKTHVIGIHGRNGARRDLARVVEVVHRLGFPAIVITYRNDFGVAPDPSGCTRYGQSEWCDVEAAVAWSLDHGARNVVLVGQSMGGGLVAAFLRHSMLATKVVRVIFDAPMLDLRTGVNYYARQHRAGAVRMAMAPVLWAGRRIASIRFRIDWSAVDYLDDGSWLKVPTLVTHGDDDDKVPIAISAALKILQPSLVTLAVFPGAGHLESWNMDRPRYTALVESFLAPLIW